jgi:hypothetical protein
LFNEGDLNGDGTDELSVFQDPMNGNTYMLTTFSLVGKEQWQKIIEPLLIPTENYLSDEALQKRIFLEKDTLYFLEVDVNDENFGLIKQKAVLK